MTREELFKTAKPILFNTDMVKAILDGKKTVTRRICKDGNDYTVPDMEYYDAEKRTYAVHNYADKDHTNKLSIAERTCSICPGDILYIRETWQYIDFAGENNGYVYKASENGSLWESETYEWIWKPSIHMPKEAARIFLRVSGVRVERLQDMTEEDALKEGCETGVLFEADETLKIPALRRFQKLWNNTIKKPDIEINGWAANPYVWVIEFEKMEVES